METRLYPQSVANNNVPDDVYLIADVSLMDGEIHQTYYINRDGGMFEVSDWKGHKPVSVAMYKLTRITGDTEQMIYHRWNSYFYWKDKESV